MDRGDNLAGVGSLNGISRKVAPATREITYDGKGVKL